MDSNPGENPSGSDSLSVHSGTPPDSPLGGSRSDLQSVSTRGGLGAGRGRRGGGGVPPPSSVTRRSLPNLAAQTSGLAPPKPTQLSRCLFSLLFFRYGIRIIFVLPHGIHLTLLAINK